jgi:hypothetical protein
MRKIVIVSEGVIYLNISPCQKYIKSSTVSTDYGGTFSFFLQSIVV